MTRKILIAGLAGLALTGLSACGKPASPSAGSSPPSAAAAPASAPASGPVSLNDMPRRKDGLWEQTLATGAGGQAIVTQICTDVTVERKVGMAGQRFDRSKCASYSITRQLNGDYAFSSVCSLGATGGTVTSHGVMHRDGDGAFHVDLDTTTSGAAVAQLNTARKMTLDAKWMGPCPPGQKPGDMVVNGMKINLLSSPAYGQGPGG